MGGWTIAALAHDKAASESAADGALLLNLNSGSAWMAVITFKRRRDSRTLGAGFQRSALPSCAAAANRGVCLVDCLFGRVLKESFERRFPSIRRLVHYHLRKRTFAK
jgi:hypothetical protein